VTYVEKVAVVETDCPASHPTLKESENEALTQSLPPDDRKHVTTSLVRLQPSLLLN
jgi:hypothetical protein